MTRERVNVLVTGAAGMIGSHLVKALLRENYNVIGLDRSNPVVFEQGYKHIVCELGDIEILRNIVQENQITRIIHLAALAHSAGLKKISYEEYYYINVECAKNIFVVAAEKGIPVLFSSTVDVYGFTKGIVNSNTELNPVTPYGISKMLAEDELSKICADSGYTIFRFAPVYTETLQRDIQKRYYLKYPNVAYIIGKGTEYEILHIDVATDKMVEWTTETIVNGIRVIKNRNVMNTSDKINEEKEAGRAKTVVHFPKWMVVCAYVFAKAITGKNKYTYLLNKAVHPMKTEW